MNEPILPDNDKDLELARRIGAMLASKQFSSEALKGDPFGQALLKFKKEAGEITTPEPVTPEQSDRMWAAIEGAMGPNRTADRPASLGARIFRLSPTFSRIAIAASVLVALVIGWYVIQQQPSQLLVAEAGAASVTHTLNDGSQITLRPHSRLFEMEARSSAHRYRLEGEALFAVTSNPQRTFAVEAGIAEVAVLGTTFSVSTWNDDVTVFLEEGRIALTHIERDEQVILTPGQSGTLTETAPIAVNESADTDEFLDWLNDELTFKNKAAQDIVDELAFHFNTTIELPPSRAPETLSGFVPLTNVETALTMLEQSMGGGRFTQIGDNAYRFEPDR